MPPSNAREDQRYARLFPALFWGGVGLTPVAALILLIGSGTGSLRFAVTLVLLAMVLIGLSITLRKESDTMRADLEETIYDEIDVMRGDVRDDIGHAVQATHRAFGEKMQYLLDQLEATRAELESTRGQLEALRQTGPARISPSGQRQGVAPGLVRHTETVQVTTRHTVMDPHEERGGTTYGTRQPAYRGSNSNGNHANGNHANGNHANGDDSWTEQRLRDQLERRRESNEPISAGSWQQGQPYEQHWSAPIVDDDDRPGLRAGDRWASVRADDRGREVRMGERRAAMHADGFGGTELRIEDRWAAVRREAGLDRQGWGGGYDERDREYEHQDRRAITGPERQDRWSDYRDDRDRERDREWDRYR
jgi:hypothetical protein